MLGGTQTDTIHMIWSFLTVSLEVVLPHSTSIGTVRIPDLIRTTYTSQVLRLHGNNLKEVLEAHKRWLDKSEEWSAMDKADLSGADLRNIDLSGASMRGVNLRGANLINANLTEANLIEANLSGANLSFADLGRAYLSGADLINTDLSGANLDRACLGGADLGGADLSYANLSGTNLINANLINANLRRAKNVPFIPLACPDSGAFVAWKNCETENGSVIVKLLIPEDARRSSGTGRKCRSDRAIVLDIQTIDGDTVKGAIAWSRHDKDFTYEVGKTVTPNKPFCENRFNECSSGIHFFVNRQEAVEY